MNRLAVKLAGRDHGFPWDSVDVNSDPDWDWRTGASDAPSVVCALWRAAVERSRIVVVDVVGVEWPTPDHFPPARYLAGRADACGAAAHREVLVDGYACGPLSMTAYTLGTSCPDSAGVGGSPRPPAVSSMRSMGVMTPLGSNRFNSASPTADS